MDKILKYNIKKDKEGGYFMGEYDAFDVACYIVNTLTMENLLVI